MRHASPCAGTTSSAADWRPRTSPPAPRRRRSAAISRSASGPVGRLERLGHRAPARARWPSCSPGSEARAGRVARRRRCSPRPCGPRPRRARRPRRPGARAPARRRRRSASSASLRLLAGRERVERARPVGRLDHRLRRDRADAGARPGDDASRRRTSATGRRRRARPCRGSWATIEYVPRRMARELSRSLRADASWTASAHPEGFVRAYGDVSPGAPRFAGTVLCRHRRPGPAVVADRARRRLAGEGRPPARAAGGRGRARSAASASTCARALPDLPVARCGSSARSRLRRRGRAASTSSRARSSAALPELARPARRAAAPVHPPHLGVADAQRERLARRAARLRDLVRRRRARGRAVWTHTLEGPDDMPAHIKASLLGPSLTLPVARRPPRARHLAGDLPLRAPRPRRRRGRCSPR